MNWIFEKLLLVTMNYGFSKFILSDFSNVNMRMSQCYCISKLNYRLNKSSFLFIRIGIQRLAIRVSQFFFAHRPLLSLKNNNRSSRPCLCKYSVQMIGIQNFKFIFQNWLWIAADTSSIHDNALHDLTLNKIIVTHFMGTVSFLIRYSSGHTK